MDNLLSDLNEQQQKVVQTTAGPVLVLAGAGSGKTRALTYRITYLLTTKKAAPGEILAVTFTNKAAGEMKDRVSRLLAGRPAPSSISTFHSLGARILREQWKLLPRSGNFLILDAADSERAIKLAMDELSISRREFSPRFFQRRISNAKNQLLQADDLASSDERHAEMVAAVFVRYQNTLSKNDAYDFDDLITVPIELLANHPSIQQTYQSRWRYLLVDEYQDTNPPQDKILNLLVGPQRNICVVGDDYQAIYGWRGSKVDHILNFEKIYPGCATIYLTRNYRSTPAILSAANNIIADNKLQKHKHLWTANQPGPAVQLISFSSNEHEAAYIRQQIEDCAASGGQRRDHVILYRTNAQSRAFEEEFLTHSIPYTIIGGFRFYERREIKDALALLQMWVSPNSLLPLYRLAESLWRGIGPKTLQRWEKEAGNPTGKGDEGGFASYSLNQLLFKKQTNFPVIKPLVQAFTQARQMKFNTVSELLEYLLKQSGYLKQLANLPDGEERLENIEELLNVTAAYDNPEKFLQEVSLLSDIDTLKEEQDRVTCMTLHASKGLEFPSVYVVGCEEGLLPHSNSLASTAEIEEERRLLYVGITRAKTNLTLTYALTRYQHGDYSQRSPSRFLDSLPPEVQRIDPPDKGEAGGFLSFSPPYEGEVRGGESENEPIYASAEEGTIINHPHFGRGVVIESKGATVTCVFARYGVKTVEIRK